MSELTRDGTAESVSRDHTLRHERGGGNIHFPCSTHHEQDRQPYPVEPYCVESPDYAHNRISGSVLYFIFSIILVLLPVLVLT